MKSLILLLMTMLPVASYASENQVNVAFNGQLVNVLTLVSEDSRMGALLQINSSTCYTGDQIAVIHQLNGVFNMAERSSIVSKGHWAIIFTQATTPNIPERNHGLGSSIGIEYEVQSGSYPIKRFTIQPCSS